MRPETKIAVVVIVGALHLMSGLAGIAVGGVSAQAGWWLVVVGSLLTGFGLRELRRLSRSG